MTVAEGTAMPEVRAYPVCDALDCDTPYVLRRCWTFGAETQEQWLWQRDCKHKKAGARVESTDG